MRNKNKNRKTNIVSRSKQALIISGSFILVVGAGLTPSFAKADQCSSVSDCTQQEQSLQQQNSQNQQSVNQLLVQASNYQDAVNLLQSQISGLESQITTNEATQASLQQQIQQDQTELDQQKQVLASDITAMYMNGQMTTVEMLATSKNLSQFIDAETYRSAVQDKVQLTLDQITKLQAQLKLQQDEVTNALAAQHTQQDQLNADESQQSSLLAMTQDQEAAYTAQIQSNQSQISALQARIAVLNTPVGSDVTLSGTCGGGYPNSTPNRSGSEWGCDYAKDNAVDNWGMDNRECVSYTAFRVHEEYVEGKIAHDMPNWGGVGDAYQWIGDAESAGIPVDQTPQAGDIAIRPASGAAGDVGHAMYVESVNSNGTINVSQYNADLRGDFSYVSGRSTAGLYFLHFSEWK